MFQFGKLHSTWEITEQSLYVSSYLEIYRGTWTPREIMTSILGMKISAVTSYDRIFTSGSEMKC